MKKNVKTELNKYLKSLEKADLEKEIMKLYTRFKEVKEFYEMELAADKSKLLEQFKERIRKEYFPSRGHGKARSRESKKAITDFKKISVFKEDEIDLLLYRAEMMVDFTSAYGEVNDPFYDSLVSSFDEACELIRKENLEERFKIRCKSMVLDTRNFGWGLHDELNDIFQSCFGPE